MKIRLIFVHNYETACNIRLQWREFGMMRLCVDVIKVEKVSKIQCFSVVKKKRYINILLYYIYKFNLREI